MSELEEFLDEPTRRLVLSLRRDSLVLDDETILTFEDLRYIRMAMVEACARWYNIGVHFGISLDILDKIRAENRRDSDRCLTLVISEWLKNSQSCTWKKVIIALSSRVGGDNPALAYKIAKNYQDYGSENVLEGLEMVDNRPLTAVSIPFVLAALAEGVPDKWDSVGIYLGIPYKVIEWCRLEDTLEEKMRAMVRAWIERKHDVEKFGQPSWRKLVEAVAHKSGGYNRRLATNLAPNHPVISEGTNPEPAWNSTSTVATATEVAVTIPSTLPTEELNEADLPVLMNLLMPIASRWDILCLQLGVLQSTIDNISIQPMRMSGAPRTFLQDGLYTWLLQGFGVCTITALCKALEAPSVAELTLSYHVESQLKHHKGLPS